MVSTWQTYEMDPPADLIEADSGSALDLAASMDLICVATEQQAGAHLRRGSLDPLPLPFDLATLPYGLVRWRQRHLRPGAAIALGAVKDALRSRRQAMRSADAQTGD